MLTTYHAILSVAARNFLKHQHSTEDTISSPSESYSSSLNTILLWCLPYKKVPIDSILLTEIHELLVTVFSSIIRSQILYFSLCLDLNLHLSLFELVKDLGCIFHKINSVFTRKIIIECHKVARTSNGGLFCRPLDITMDIV